MASRRPFSPVVAALALANAAGAAPFFSVDPTSPTAVFVSSSSVLSPGPVGGPPVEETPAAALGLAAGGELDAMTAGGGLGLMHFSVARAAVGTASFAPDVKSQAAAGQAAGDIFAKPHPFLDYNGLVINQDALGLLPAVGPGVAVAPPIDNLDALDLAAPVPLLLSLANGHPFLGTGLGCGGDLFAPGPVPVLAISHLALGLACDDDIDALHLDTVVSPGDLYFSLAPGSPFLAVGGVPPCGGGCSPADIFVAIGGVAPLARAARSFQLKLAATDDVTALAFRDCPIPVGDADGDGVDDACDSCLGVSNPSQFDSDNDGYGNKCDADYDQNGKVGITDSAIFRGHFACGTVGGVKYFPHNDHDVDGVCGGMPDYAIFRSLFGRSPGPSALACAGTVPCTF